MKRIALMLIVFMLAAGVFRGEVLPEYSYAEAAVPEILATSGILIDANSGEILYCKNEHMRLEPASTTKMITCLLALENLDLDEVMVIDPVSPFTGGSRIYLIEGEEITVREVLYGLMLESANDCAVALAIRMAGSVEAFADMMNRRAKELGALNTTFVNPNGLHEEGHLTTAYDLAMIAKACMKNETFRMYCSTYKHTIPATNKQEERYLYNTNRLLYDEKTQVPVNGEMRPAKYEGVTGIKTGWTSQAQGCLAAGAERDGVELISVVMQSTDGGRFGDSIALLDFGFANYRTYKVLNAGDPAGTVAVHRGAQKTVDAVIADDAYLSLPVAAPDSIVTTETVWNADKFPAPVTAGQKLGTVNIYQSGAQVAQVAILAAAEVTNGGILSVFGFDDETGNRILFVAGTIIIVLLALFVIYMVLAIRKARRRKRRRQQRAMEIALERRRRAQEERYR